MILLFLIPSLVCGEGNATTYPVDIRNEHYRTTRYTAILFITIFLLYGIISNTLMVTALFHKVENNYSREFVLITLQIIIAHFLAFIPQIFVLLTLLPIVPYGMLINCSFHFNK